jgi:DeoR family suf operon transcriptional repressor
MTNGEPALAGFRGLRGHILLEVKKSQPITAKALSEAFGVSANAIRRHLKELEAEGLVRYGRQQRGVGAPAFAYTLTSVGEALFPKEYEDALTSLLEEVARRDGRPAVVEMLEKRWSDLTERLGRELDRTPVERRLEVVARALSEAGYMAEWEESEGTFRLAEHNCAIRAVAERFPEVCAAEERFLRQVLAAHVERRTHIVSGCNSCEYTICADGAGTAAPNVERMDV